MFDTPDVGGDDKEGTHYYSCPYCDSPNIVGVRLDDPKDDR